MPGTPAGLHTASAGPQVDASVMGTQDHSCPSALGFFRVRSHPGTERRCHCAAGKGQGTKDRGSLATVRVSSHVRAPSSCPSSHSCCPCCETRAEAHGTEWRSSEHALDYCDATINSNIWYKNDLIWGKCRSDTKKKKKDTNEFIYKTDPQT